MTTALLFPGQNLPVSRYCLAKALSSTLLQAAMSANCKKRAEMLMNELTDDFPVTNTELVQPIVFLQIMALFYENHHRLKDARLFMGHSLGEYAALVASGGLSFKDGFSLVTSRGSIMQRNSKGSKWLMAACIPREELRNYDELRTRIENCDVNLASWNNQFHFVVSGKHDQVTEALIRLRKERFISRSKVLLQPYAFHSKFFKESAAEFQKHVVELELPNNEKITNVISNLTAKPFTNLTTEVSQQICSPVRWYESLLFARQHGITKWITFGPSTVLPEWLKRTIPDGAANHFDVM